MRRIAGVTVSETLLEGGKMALLRGRRDSDGQSVLVRAFGAAPQPHDIDRVRQDFDLTRALESPFVCRPLSLEEQDGLPIVVLSDTGQVPLATLVGEPLPMEAFLVSAVAVADAVAAVHALGLIHRELRPENILVGGSPVTARIADFGSAVRTPQAAAGVAEGFLPYLSPEQTGRTKRPVDARSDLYSLGIVFYEMATGRRPFEAQDVLGWVHCHIARAPRPPRELVPELPEVVGAIILRLLAKLPEERYQSAEGLRHDLALALAELRRDRVIAPFPLGREDRSDRLKMPHRLYGRGLETRALLGAFERMLAAEAPELVLVAGPSGAGKSSLVQELQAPVVRERGVLVVGKADPQRTHVPFATIAQALRELIQKLLTESEEQLASVRDRLRAALGTSAQVVVDVVPEVQLVLGEQPPPPEVPPNESQARSIALFRRFVALFATRERPLVVFLDDLQWADAATLALLTHLLSDPAGGCLLVVGAYRDTAVDEAHSLAKMASGAREGGATLTRIDLQPLTRQDLARMCQDMIGGPASDAERLAELVHEKTGGNPFFAIQFLFSMKEELLLAFDRESGCFRWDPRRVRAKGFTDNVVDLVVGRLRRLRPEAQELLRLAACLGSRFPVEALMAVSSRALPDVLTALEPSVQAGLLLVNDHEYVFGHDRVQQAAYGLIPEAERPPMHLRIGRLLLARAPREALEDKPFEVVDHLHRGAAAMTDAEERVRLAELDLLAGRRAKAAGAYGSAVHYLGLGLTLLPEDAWAARYELAFALGLERAACAYLAGDFEAAQTALADLEPRARTDRERAEVLRVQIALFTTRGELDRGIEVGLEALRRFGVDIPTEPTRADVDRAYERVRAALAARGLEIEDIANVPDSGDPDVHVQLGLLSDLSTPTLFARRNLFYVLLAHIVVTSIERGPASHSVRGYVFFGFTLVQPDFARYRDGFRFGKMAYEIVKRRGPATHDPLVALMYGDIIRLYGPEAHLRDNRPFIEEAFRGGLETGSLVWACYSCNHFVSNLLAAGEPLSKVWQESEARLAFVRRARDPNIEAILVSQQCFIRNMRGRTSHLSTFDGAAFDDASFVARIQESQMSLVACWHDILKIQARFLSRDYDEALRASERARALLWATGSDSQVTDFFFYTALAAAALLDEERDDAPALRALVVQHARQLRDWAAAAEVNFGDRAALLDAEVARVEGRDADAARSYEVAIRAARANGFVHQEAVAYEVASTFYRRRGFEQFADAYLESARDCYARWGADGKVLQLEQRFPQLARPRGHAAATAVSFQPDRLDLLSVAKAAQTISREIVLDKLVSTLLEVVMEESGARRGALILVQGGELSTCVEAESRPVGFDIRHLGPQQGLPSALPASVLAYVRRTKKPLLLDEAAARMRFGADFGPAGPPRSLACLPLVRQEEVVGLLYLSNDLLGDALTPERLTVVEILAAQAVISLENATLLARERAARQLAEASQRRAAFLVEATASLSATLLPSQPLGRLARAVLEYPADWCVIDHLEERGLVRIGAAHADPMKEILLTSPAGAFPLDVPEHPAARVAKSGAPVLVTDVDEGSLRELFGHGAHGDFVSALGLRSAMFVPLASYGRPLGLLVVASTATGRAYDASDLETVVELARRAATAWENAQLYERAQRAIRLRDEFLSVASHELATPMTSLVLSLQGLLKAMRGGDWASVPPASLGRLFELAVRQGDRLNGLVGNLLDVSRIESGRLHLELARVDLAVLVRDVVDRFELNLARAGCRVTIDAEECWGSWDGSRIDQAFTNLLSNAIKFGAEHPIEITVRPREGHAELSIVDHGIGIDEEEQGRIFGRFERAVSSDHYPGLGLGLYICGKIVTAHGGTIAVASKPGAGTRFTLELPMDRTGEDSHPAGGG